jgi:hypothetical protein
MRISTDTRLRIAEVSALDLTADTEEQLRLLEELRRTLHLKHAMAQGACAVIREQLESANRTTSQLLDNMRAHRAVLNEVRAALRALRSQLIAAGTLDERRRSARQGEAELG